MSTLGEANRDAYRGSIDEGSAAPLMGFMDAMDASWQSATKVHSLLAVEQSMRSLEQEQIKKIREAGLRPPKSLDDSEDVGTGPFGGAQFRQGRYSAAAQSVVDGGGWYTDELVAERNKEIETLRKERPDLGLMTYEEIFAKVREQSQEIEKRAQGPTTMAGTIGGFIGGMAGAMNPVSDPINAATMFLNGGAGVAGRIGFQGLAQAGVETANMALTPNNENILLDRRPTFGEDMARIGFAAAGGAGGQALGEAVAMGARRLTTGRWFNDVPPPPEPIARPEPPPEPIGEVPPPMAPGRPFNDYPDYETFRAAHKLDFEEAYGKTRPAELRRALDLDHVTRELDRWGGPAPFEIEPPRTDVAFRREIADGVTYDRPYQKYLDNLDTVDDIARRIDPDLFRTYDKLVRQRDEIRAEIEAERVRVAQFKGADTFFDAAEAQFREGDLLRRDSLQAIDQQMRDLAPLVTRAYSAAEKEWRSTPMDWNTMSFLKGLEERTGFRYRGPTLETIRPHSPEVAKLKERADFVEWFKGSKALDPDGKPAIVYHGTVRAFDDFDLKRAGEMTGAPSAKEGIFFSSDTRVAESYATPPDEYHSGDRLIDKLVSAVDKLTRGYYAKFNEKIVALFNGPRDVDAPNIRPAYLDMKDPLIVDYKGADYRETTYYDAIQQAKAEGKDGVIFKNTYDPGFDGVQEHPADIFVVFRPEQIRAFSERYEAPPSLTEQPMRLTDTKAPPAPARTVDDIVPLARLTPDVEGKVKVNANADATERVRSNVADEQVAVDEKIDAFVTAAAKVTKLTDVEIRDALKVLEEKIANVDPKAENADEVIAKLRAEIDDLKYVTLPDGSRLDQFNDRVPYVDANGNETQMRVRDFLREMQKDNDALKSVVTCSRPS